MNKNVLSVRLVETASELKEFLKFPWRVYGDDPNWVPPLYMDRKEMFDRDKHPFFKFAEVDLFMAWRGNEPVGTIAAILNHRHNEFHEESVAHFGFFEALDSEVATTLLNRVCDWAREKKKDKVLGPASFSSNYVYGMLVDGFDGPPAVEMSYNPPTYPQFVEDAGFAQAMDLWAWYFPLYELYGSNAEHLPEKLTRVVGKIKKRYDIKIREINLSDWDNEVALFQEIYNSAWSKNWGFVPLTDPEMHAIAESLRMIVDPRVTFFAEIDGVPIGASVPLPNINEVLHRVRPGPSTFSTILAYVPLFLQR
ncbi:MAG: N-acetyltransferase, partial [Chloroflexota bacterium]